MDCIEVTIVPILLGAGVPLLNVEAARTQLTLITTKTYRSGMISLHYAVPSAQV